MFFSSVLFTKRGNLAKVWLAAHHQDKRLTKAIVVSTNIEECSHELSEPKVPLSLRISGQLLLGVVRIYQRKVRYLQEDTQEALTKVRMSSRPGAGALELHPSHATATSSHITFVDPIENDFLDFAIPDIPLNRLDEICEDGFSQQEMGRAHDMMLEQDDRFSYNMSLNQGAKQFDDVHDVLMTGEEDVIRIEPLVHADDKLDESVEVGRDAQDFDADIPLLPLDIDYAEPLKDGESESILAPDHGAMTEELIPLIDPLNDNVSILGHGHDQSVLGSVDLAQDFAGDINIAVKKSRKRKRVQHDRSIQISSAELMNQDTSQLVAKRGEFVLQPEPPMLGSTSADMPDWLLAPSEAIGPLCQELVNVLASNLEKANLTTAAETNERPEIDENCLIEGSGPRDDAPANRAEDNLDVSQKDSPGQFYDEPPSFFDDGAPAPDHQVEDFSQKGSGFDDDDGRKFEEQFINPEPLIASEIVAEPEAAEDEASQSGAFSSWSERTKKMCVLLSERLDKDDASLSLQSLIQGKSRSTAAIIFLETLILKTHDFIDLDQQQPYGEIDIKPASRFQTGIPVADMLAITG